MTQVTISAETLDALTIEGLRQARDDCFRDLKESAAKGRWDDVMNHAENLLAVHTAIHYFIGIDQ